MAFNPQQINPLDLNPNKGIGVNIPFNAPGVFSLNYLTKDAIKNNLINFFLTNPGEIYMNPSFGGGLRAFIFEQIVENNIEGIQKNIESKIEDYFPLVLVQSVNIIKNEDTNSIIIEIKYSIANSNINDNLVIEF
jgi:phage baseplate assembly protein W